MAAVKSTIPNVIGQSESQAIASLQFVGFKTQIKYITNASKASGVCTGTNPEPNGKFYALGTMVTVRVNNYVAPTPETPAPLPETPAPPPSTSPPPQTGGPDPVAPTQPPPPSTPIIYSFYAPITPAPVPAVPPWSTTPTFETPKGIKQATPDIIIFDEETVDVGYIAESYFEEYGGSELINISRHDLINGRSVSYSPIINLPELRRQFNSNNIIGIEQYQRNETKYNIDLVKRGPGAPYFDDNGDLIIEIDTVKPDESIEIQLATSGTINRILT